MGDAPSPVHRRLPGPEKTFCELRSGRKCARDPPEALAVRNVPRMFRQDQSDLPDLTNPTDQQRWARCAPWLEHVDHAVRANRVIRLTRGPS